MVKPLDTDDLISQAQAAELRGVTRAAINDLVRRGRLRTKEVARKKLLYKSEVMALQLQKGGRPSKRSQKKAPARKKK